MKVLPLPSMTQFSLTSVPPMGQPKHCSTAAARSPVAYEPPIRGPLPERWQAGCWRAADE
jgi:hypothetical protein